MLGRIFSYVRARSATVTLSGEEARTAIRALERSACAMPEPTETFQAREMRSTREIRLAKAIGLRLPKG